MTEPALTPTNETDTDSSGATGVDLIDQSDNSVSPGGQPMFGDQLTVGGMAQVNGVPIAFVFSQNKNKLVIDTGRGGTAPTTQVGKTADFLLLHSGHTGVSHIGFISKLGTDQGVCDNWFCAQDNLLNQDTQPL